MSRRDARVLPGLLFALGAALSGLTILQGISPHDEGLMLAAGSRIVSGQWIYRDFWLNYPPGQPVLLAGLQELFGASLLAWRVMRTLIDAGIGVLAFVLVSRWGARRSVALLVWLAVAGAMAWPTGPGPNPPALLLGLAALLAADGERPVLAGVLAGLVFPFRFELGVAGMVAVVMLVPAGTRGRCAVAAVLAALVPMVPFVLVAPGALWHDTFGFYGIQSLQRLPFPLSSPGSAKPNKLLEYYLPAILVTGVALYAVRLFLTRDRVAVALAPLVLVSLAYLLGRTDEFHLIPLAVVVPVALGARTARQGRVLRIGAAGGVLVVALIALHGLDRRSESLIHPLGGAAVPGAAGDGVQTTSADALQLRALEHAVGRVARPGEPIFVADPRHDRVSAGDPLLYVILGHPNPTRYDVMQPGLVTTAPVQRELVRELAHTRFVIRWLDPRAEAAAPHTAGAHILDRYLASRFAARQRFGVYQLLERRR